MSAPALSGAPIHLDQISMNHPMRTVNAVSTPAGYIGGKRSLAKRIASIIASIPHVTYAEAFVGMGGVFLKRTAAPKAEVINDFNGEVANLFRILQRHYPQFIDTLRFQLSGRREFDRLRATDPATLTDLERAGRFLYLQRLAFGGKVAGQNFGVDVTSSAAFNLSKLEPMLADVHDRLVAVTIENLPWQKFVDRYDREGTLFYLDPPYWGSEGDYGRELFSRDQFELMAARLRELKGRFILSINDLPETRALFAGFEIEEAELFYGVKAGGATKARELIVLG